MGQFAVCGIGVQNGDGRHNLDGKRAIKKPNILFITTDQQRYDAVRTLGNELIITPHLDMLARQGMVFTKAYADCPLCIPARWTIMNGQRASTFDHAYFENGV